VIVLFCLSWRLAPAVSIVIVVTAVAAALYRRSTRPVEAAQSAALQRMAGVAYQAFQNMRTVRSFAGGFVLGWETAAGLASLQTRCQLARWGLGTK
jgi:ABC-type multidrug transport system fused ATPase/permease subunit